MNINIPIPLYKKDAPWGTNVKPDSMKDIMNSIMTKYGEIIHNVSILTKVPKEIILSTITIESNGRADVKSDFPAYGLMQLTLPTANDIIKMEKRKGCLTDAEFKALGNRLTGFTEDDLFNPATNVLIGSIYLGILIDEETVPCLPTTINTDDVTFKKYNQKLNIPFIGKVLPKQTRMDRVTLRYNGYYTKLPPKFSSYQTIYESALNSMKPYLLKVLGVNGTLDLLTK